MAPQWLSRLSRHYSDGNALTNEEVLDMLTGDRLPPRIVAEKIKKARNCAFDTSREALKKLKASGVPDSVIVAMVRAS
jgi:cobalamin biosynthesis Co2+ chelatase CbiK